MALSISLSHNDRTQFTPGSMVLGVVKLTNYEDQIIDSCKMDFRGQSNAFLSQNYSDIGSSRADVVSKTYLFSRHLDLYSGEGLHHKGTHLWPFAFRIPLFAAPRLVPPGSKELFYPKSRWRGDFVVERHKAHPLPPSMQERGKFACNVRYTLEAVLSYRVSGATKGKKLQASYSIPVQNLEMSPRISAGDEWIYMIHRHTLSCAIVDSSHQHFLRHLRIFPWKDKHLKPEVKLCVSVLLPKEIVIKERQTLSVPVACTMEQPSEADGPKPRVVEQDLDLVVHSFSLSLFRHTEVRAGCHHSSSVRKIFIRKGTCIVPVSRTSSSDPNGAENSPNPIVNLSNIVDLSIPRQSLAPDFSTYNIARFHTIEMRFSLIYGGKKNKFALRNVPMRVIPQSEGELESRLNEGVEPDDEFGCDLVGIQWRDYRGTAGASGCDPLGLASDFDDDLCPAIPPPTYTV
ncbi:uncharacterized protein A1O9_12051 [Exophiala aquamarina CBS 119918]|uniref:Arrestin-like N-terminal domain-containing protein n=1 Tax=Exophiala aquamarina CBS 119918 TaxID=1182545 RepID=A0A072NWR5_9EURO|nr:uncharacterized protein A1O9_12051 [Exophiala aquamarina CBS 119918]KEF52061.1 hypothetical protein A1O9_12051 [Exophiala aquamarina CBS 119918]